MVPIVSIVGKRDSGKTTVLEKILSHMHELGYIVGTIKHDAHDFEIDHPGKDTYRHFHAGANRVMIAAAHKVALVQNIPKPLSLDELMDRYFLDVDLVLTEGFKSEKKPKIEVFRSQLHATPLCTKDDQLLAFISDTRHPIDVPHFAHHEIEQVTKFVIDQFALKSPK